ncbi:MAG: hypothetical protein QM650_11465 [Microlunatus sp.]
MTTDNAEWLDPDQCIQTYIGAVVADASAPSTGRIVFRAIGAGYFALISWQAFTLPDDVPGQLDFGGEVTRWGSRTGHILLGLFVGILIIASFSLTPRIAFKNTALLNLPHKDYWTRPENWPTAQQRLRNYLSWLGALTLTFVGYAMWTVGVTATAEPPPAWAFIAATGVFLATILGYAIWMMVGPRWQPPVSRR